MKASELRIGNWVALFPLTFKIETISRDLIHVDNKGSYAPLHIEKAEPIPLTEEWLVKFGFEFDENKGGEHEGQKFEDRPLWYLKRPDDSRFCVYLDSKTCYVSIPCEFVHELQNAFFTVERQELTINEGK